jgi:outer membrane receptor protein involved in Fe transport
MFKMNLFKGEYSKMNLFIGNKRVTRGLFALSALTLFAPLTWAQSDEDAEEGADDKKGYFDEIIVTAEKTEKNVMETAMTITAFNADMLKELGIQDRDKLQILVPGLQFGETRDQEGNGTSLRGIGTRNAGIDHGDRAVATYVDGAYTIGVYGVAPGGGFDLERVEVARGPQGTLNGRNSIAGSINYVYKKPTQDWDMEVMAQVNDVVQQRLNLAIGGPITESLSFRVTGGVHTGDGYQENVGLGPDAGAPDHKFYAGQLRFQTEKFDSNIRISRVTDNGIPTARVQLSNLNTTDPTILLTPALYPAFGNEPPEVLSLGVNTGYLYATQTPSGPSDCPIGTPFFQCGDIENKVANNRTGFEDSQADMINLYMQYDFTDSVSLRYTYSDNDVSQYVFKDADYTTRVAGTTNYLSADGGVEYLDRAYELPYNYTEESHELVLTAQIGDKLTLIAGAFSYESAVAYDLTRFEFSHDWRFTDPDAEAAALGTIFGATFTNCQEYVENLWGGVFGLPTAPSGTSTFVFCPGDFDLPGQTTSDLTGLTVFGTASVNKTNAVFANLDYEINDQWAVSGGLRWLEDEKTQGALAGFSMSTSFLTIPIVFGFFDGAVDQVETWDNLVGQMTLEYTLGNDSMVYGRISTGHKPGVFNFSSPPVPGVPVLVEESTLINYELGLKGTYFDGRLQLATGAYLMNYDKMHLAAIQPLTGSFTPAPDASSPLAEYTAAIPDTDVWGLETEYSFAFSDRTSLMGFYAYNDSKIGEHSSVVFGDPAAQYSLYSHLNPDNPTETIQSWYQLPSDQSGNRLPSSPKHKFAATLIHQMDLTSGASLSFIGTYSYTGSMYPTIANIERNKIPAYDRVDMSLGWNSPDQSWSAMLYVNNVLDEIGLNEFIAASGLGSQLYLGSPTNHREIGMTFRWYPSF